MTGGAPNPVTTTLRRLGLTLALLPACARAVCTYDPLPGWGLDPLTTIGPQNGLGPADSMLLAAVSLLGLTLVLAAAWRSRDCVPRALLALGSLGLVPIAYHGWLGPTTSVENAATGLAWVGAIAGGLAACVACVHAPERRLVLACCAGLAAPLAVRAVIQVYVEHPILVDDFRANREAFLASHGWTPGSSMARSFERRLSSPDASAWFAMSNVYASVMAGCVAVFAAAGVQVVRERLWQTDNRADLYRTLGIAAGLACSLGGLFVAIPAGGDLPKGAAAAMVLGLALVALGLLAGRLPQVVRSLLRPRLLGPALLALALLAVLLRGLIGERLGELSILFRFYYAQAAVRTFTDHPLWGVGPDGFQAAYLLNKNPLSPEEVVSPHSVLLDYLSMLGVLALAWCALLVAFASRAGASLLASFGVRSPSEEPDASTPASTPYRWLILIILVAAAVSFARETLPLAASAPDAFGLLVVDGLTKQAVWGLLWLGLAAALLSLRSRPCGSLALGLAAGALAVVTHAQIELTLTDVSSSAWALLLLGAAAAGPLAPATGSSEDDAADSTPATPLLATIGTGLLCAAALVTTIPVRAWQTELRATSTLAAEPTAFIQRAQALAAGTPDDSPDALFTDLAAATGRVIPRTVDGFNSALDDFRLTRLSEVADRLEALARRVSVPSRATADAAIDTRLKLAALSASLGHDPKPACVEALQFADWVTASWPADSRSWRNLAQATYQASDLAPTLAEPDADLPPLLRAAELDPFSPQLAHQLAARFAASDRPAEAAEWAARALANHESRHLDPLAGLSENQVQEMRELLGDP